MILGDGCVVDGIFLIGECIEFATQSFYGVDNLQGVATLSALEGHVLTEMRQPFLFPKPFVTGACSYLITAVDHL